jgi:hypothetical protein
LKSLAVSNTETYQRLRNNFNIANNARITVKGRRANVTVSLAFILKGVRR